MRRSTLLLLLAGERWECAQHIPSSASIRPTHTHLYVVNTLTNLTGPSIIIHHLRKIYSSLFCWWTKNHFNWIEFRNFSLKLIFSNTKFFEKVFFKWPRYVFNWLCPRGWQYLKLIERDMLIVLNYYTHIWALDPMMIFKLLKGFCILGTFIFTEKSLQIYFWIRKKNHFSPPAEEFSDHVPPSLHLTWFWLMIELGINDTREK